MATTSAPRRSISQANQPSQAPISSTGFPFNIVEKGKLQQALPLLIEALCTLDYGTVGQSNAVAPAFGRKLFHRTGRILEVERVVWVWARHSIKPAETPKQPPPKGGGLLSDCKSGGG